MRMPFVKRDPDDRAEGRAPGPGRGPARGRGLVRSLLAVGCGALPALAFPAPGLWWWAYLALVPWMLLIRTAPGARRAAVDGWLGGAGFILAVHHWLLPSLHVFLLPLAALLGLLWLPWGWLVRSLLCGSPSPARATAALLAVPSGWLLIELVRSWEGLGGPWGLLGASQWEVPAALRLASVGGVWLVSLLVVAVNTAVVLLVAAPGPRAVGVAGLAACALVAGSAAWGVGAPREDGTVRVALVQPGVFDGADGAERRFDRAEELTRSLAGQRLDLVIWGESGVGADPAGRPDLAARLTALARAVDAPLLVNVDARGADRPGIFKSAVLVGPAGLTGDRYDKMRLVPFGEYVPARGALGWVTSFGKAAEEDRRRGSASVVMTLPGEAGAERLRIGPLICFESAFPDMSRRLVLDGAGLLVVQSATSTFQDSWAPAQHASLAALRAAETGRPVVHATLTGVSAVYGPDGRRVGPVLGTDASVVAVRELPLSTATTGYVRWGDWPLYGALAVVGAVCAAEGAGALRRPGAETRGPRARRARGSAGRRER
ncbi:apolipoprotein N-acyltransferase [Streptomyces gardneri]|uniref:Apolipoprotein N-acyltransferase n=1 Tax=Streptomyces gardneri TaxID=66892 RepID=A0A4Y3RNG4_9ACTN|nr:apolipoprotein N-acyltransferase [Streptomyces gardneri]GEB59132.1 apolipoprotein N-acyltransferase [Streptomyces gardneri]GHH12412.1 apolipoprotein N-acyltransferase [Streptomyces gardneri]